MTRGTTRRGAHAVPDLVARAREGDPAAVARLITLVEDASPLLREVMSALGPHTGRAHVLGITGAPGVGKSTSTNALVAGMRRAGRRVGVLAIDPSSPFSGGALLGDRVRMGDHALDREVYIRSMGARGHPVGMSGARIVLHLALELQRRGGGVGAAALCGGGGQGDALIIRVPQA